MPDMKNIHISGFSDEISSDLETQLKTVKELGMEYVSLRGVGNKNICDFSVPEVQEQIKPLLDRYQIKVSSIGSPIGKIFADDEAGFEQQIQMSKRIAKITKLLDCTYVRVFSFYIPKGDLPRRWHGIIIEKLKIIVEIFHAENLTLLHENEKDIYGDTALRCKNLFNSINSSNFRGIFDFANFVQCGEDPITCYQLLKPYIAYFHIKDAISTNRENVLCGAGEGKIKEILKQAISEGYEGYLTLEPHLVLFDSLQSLELGKPEHIIRQSKAKNGREAYAMQYQALQRILLGVKWSQ